MASLSVPTTCAACGKEGGDELKACTACKLVKYCNRDCQISHRSKHKKECKKCVAELHDEALFKEPPPPEECPICFLTLPIMYKSSLFKSCCGKVICCGCIYAMKKNEGVELCPFCRTPSVSREKEDIERVKKLMDSGNAEAFFAMEISIPAALVVCKEIGQRLVRCGSRRGNLGVLWHITTWDFYTKMEGVWI